jgi:hypothetical protein
VEGRFRKARIATFCGASVDACFGRKARLRAPSTTDRPQSGPKPPIFSAAETTRYDKFVVALDDLMEQHEEDAPDGLAGRPDFREFRFKGVANELAAGIKRKIDGRSV